jgi:hypothetical protein
MNWQPIETAPRDGRMFLAYWAPFAGNNPAHGEMDVIFYDPLHDEWTDTDGGMFAEPSYWMELPEPPK